MRHLCLRHQGRVPDADLGLAHSFRDRGRDVLDALDETQLLLEHVVRLGQVPICSLRLFTLRRGAHRYPPSAPALGARPATEARLHVANSRITQGADNGGTEAIGLIELTPASPEGSGTPATTKSECCYRRRTLPMAPR